LPGYAGSLEEQLERQAVGGNSVHVARPTGFESSRWRPTNNEGKRKRESRKAGKLGRRGPQSNKGRNYGNSAAAALKAASTGDSAAGRCRCRPISAKKTAGRRRWCRFSVRAVPATAPTAVAACRPAKGAVRFARCPARGVRLTRADRLARRIPGRV
jgi:hypothetical protein